MTDAPDLPPLVAEDHVCRPCGIAYADIDVLGAPAQLVDLIGAFEQVVRAVPVDVRSRPPEPSVWSPAEYTCHVRDVLVTYTVRLHRVRREDRPMLEPMYNDLRARRFDYQHADVPAVLGQTRAAARGLIAEIGRLRPADWNRAVTRLPEEERTARWLVRQALHEVRHHTADIRAVTARLTPPPP